MPLDSVVALGRHEGERAPFQGIHHAPSVRFLIAPDRGEMDAAFRFDRIDVGRFANPFRLSLAEFDVVPVVEFPEIQEQQLSGIGVRRRRRESEVKDQRQNENSAELRVEKPIAAVKFHTGTDKKNCRLPSIPGCRVDGRARKGREFVGPMKPGCHPGPHLLRSGITAAQCITAAVVVFLAGLSALSLSAVVSPGSGSGVAS